MDFDRRLIELVREFSFLYNKEQRLFKDNGAKENAWNSIAKNISKNEAVPYTSEQAKTRWVVIRNKYTAERRRLKNAPSGSGASATESHWALYGLMSSFLDKYVNLRQSRGNVITVVSDTTISQPSPSSSSWMSEAWLDMSEGPALEIDISQESSSIVSPPYSSDAEVVTPRVSKKRKVVEDDPFVNALQVATSSFSGFLEAQQGDGGEAGFAHSIVRDLGKIQDKIVLAETKANGMMAIVEGFKKDK